MPSAAYFSEPAESGAALINPAPPAAVRALTKSMPGAVKGATGHSEGVSENSDHFAQVLKKGLTPGGDAEDAGADASSLAGAWTAGLPLPQWMLDNPELSAALNAFIREGAAENTDTATMTSVGQIFSFGETTGEKAVPAAAAAQSGSNPLEPKAAKPSVWVPTAASESPALSAPLAAEPTAAPGEIGKSPDTSQGAKLKLDFSIFDESFPEGWQALIHDGPSSAKAAPTARAPEPDKTGNAVAVPDEAVLTLSGTRSLPGKINTDNAEGAVDPLVLDIRAITASAGAASVRGQAHHAEPGTSGTSAPRSEKSAEPVSARADLRTEAGMERWSVPVEVKTAERATPAAPGQVFSRLTETQRQMVVENFSQAVLPGLQGGRETLTVDLNPPELGRVQVHVEKAANGSGVNAVLTMQDRAVGEFFQGQTDVIRKNLEEAGIQVGGLSVEIRQQFNQEAREKTSEGVQKSSGNRSGEDAHRTGESRKAASVWASSGLSRVEIMV